jgi:hypothetical protein
MATKGNIQPRADQPRVTAGSLKQDNSPNLQYRNTSIKTYGRPMGGRPAREYGRG